MGRDECCGSPNPMSTMSVKALDQLEQLVFVSSSPD